MALPIFAGKGYWENARKLEKMRALLHNSGATWRANAMPPLTTWTLLEARMAPPKLRPERMGRKPDADHIRSLLTYSPHSGLMFWKCGPRKGHHAGSRAHEYLQVFVDGENYYAHRLAWLYMTGEWPEGVIDHIDGDKRNNSFFNLRPATHAENMRNQPLRRRNRHGHTGVSFVARARLWHARITLNYREISLGYFKTKEEAIEARKLGEEKYFGEFRRGQKKKAA